MEYLFATYVDNPVRQNSILPYVVDILPHLQVGDINPVGAVIEFLSRYLHIYLNNIKYIRYPFDLKPHIIGDAAFGNTELITRIQEWGGNATFSFNENNTSWLWDLLAYKTPPNTWKAAMKNEVIATLHAIEDSSHKIVNQQIMTTAFNGIIYHMRSINEEINDTGNEGIVLNCSIK